jgi:hypothetical protein
VLQAICEALEVHVDETGQPSTTRMHRLIRARVDIAELVEAADDFTFWKTELQEVADVVGASSRP